MRKALCTYCSARKRRDPDLMPACLRYLGPRIRALHQEAWRKGCLFLILSGEFGLLRAGDQIPWYDHLLKQDEVADLTERVERQIRGLNLATLTYVTAPLATTPNIRPYYDTIHDACLLAGTCLELRELRADIP